MVKTLNIRAIAFMITFGFLFSLGLSANEAFVPDHYLSYDIKTATLHSHKIRLKDQFISWTDFVVNKPNKLLNPTLKRHNNTVNPIKNPLLHYAAYRLDYEHDLHISANVIAINQFGTFKLDTFRPESLLVPSLKRHLNWFDDSSQSVPGDHYLCYTIPPITIDNQFGFLKDQFRSRIFETLTATKFCNPAAKIHDGKQFDIVNDVEGNHLMCFDIGKRRILRFVELLNQFGNKKALVANDHEVCVPTIKIHIPTECKGSKPGDGGVCNGECPTSEICRIDAAGLCACFPEQPSCEDSTPNSDGVCNGTCTDPNAICISDSTNNKCLCVPLTPPCLDTLPDPAGVCGGSCPIGETCVVNPDQKCHCQPEITKCGLQADGQCGGECPLATDICRPMSNNSCMCSPGAILCSDSVPDPAGLCGGQCPTSQICIANLDNRCECLPVINPGR